MQGSQTAAEILATRNPILGFLLWGGLVAAEQARQLVKRQAEKNIFSNALNACPASQGDYADDLTDQSMGTRYVGS